MFGSTPSSAVRPAAAVDSAAAAAAAAAGEPPGLGLMRLIVTEGLKPPQIVQPRWTGRSR